MCPEDDRHSAPRPTRGPSGGWERLLCAGERLGSGAGLCAVPNTVLSTPELRVWILSDVLFISTAMLVV